VAQVVEVLILHASLHSRISPCRLNDTHRHFILPRLDYWYSHVFELQYAMLVED
jgi:hypothetical protein